MTIVILGKSRCTLCENSLEEKQDIVSFPAFVSNQRDPVWFFNDAAFHRECFVRHPLAQKAQTRLEELQMHLGPGHRSVLLVWLCSPHGQGRQPFGTICAQQTSEKVSITDGFPQMRATLLLTYSAPPLPE